MMNMDFIGETRALDELKDNIISNVSHELHTPITIIKNALELAIHEEDPREKDMLMKIAMGALSRQTMIVGDLIEAARFERGIMDLKVEAVDVAQVIARVVGQFKSILIEDNIKMKVDIEKDLPKVKADYQQLWHALHNLVHNAIKFNMEGGGIIIEARWEEDMVGISINDTGIGIPKDKLDKIFKRFYQLDSSATRHYGGVGMGLAIVKEKVEAYSGVITVESGLGAGSRFCLMLPIFGEGR